MGNLDQKKERLLKDFATMAEGKTSDELMPLLFAFMNKAKKDKIHFNREEISSLFESMKKDMSPEEIGKAELLMNMILPQK